MDRVKQLDKDYADAVKELKELRAARGLDADGARIQPKRKVLRNGNESDNSFEYADLPDASNPVVAGNEPESQIEPQKEGGEYQSELQEYLALD